jgi:hypothetical protein
MAWGAIAAAIGSSAVSAYGQSKTNQANREISQRQMDHQLYMSNTAYQRGMADMRKAGLNPILAYRQGGATTSPGASIAAQNPLTPFENIPQTASAVALQREQTKIAKADAKLAEERYKKFRQFGDSPLGNNAHSAAQMARSAKREADRRRVERKRLPPLKGYKTQNYNADTPVSDFMRRLKKGTDDLWRHWTN